MELIVSTRPYVLLSCAMSIDGHIDDTTDQRLLLSSPEDFDRVDAVRATCDAILIGANTIRKDNPRLLVNSDARRAERVSRGLPPYPVKVTVTASGLDPEFKFFNTGGEKIVYCPASAVDKFRDQLGSLATVVGIPVPADFGKMLDDLGQRGIHRLMVEGGGTIHTQFLSQDLADELQLVIAPFFVGQADAPRFVNPAAYPQNGNRRMIPEEVRQIGDVVLVRYRARRAES
jgi:riboflavin-specific deaminase-like protein